MLDMRSLCLLFPRGDDGRGQGGVGILYENRLPTDRQRPGWARVSLCIAPLFVQNSYYGFYYTSSKTSPSRVKLTLDELKRVTDVRCKVTFRPDADK